MKKTITMLVISCGIISNSQVLIQEDFSTFKLGNILKNDDPEQIVDNNWKVISTANENTNYSSKVFQIENIQGNTDNVLKIIGPNYNLDSFLFDKDLGWKGREVGNDNIEMSIDVFLPNNVKSSNAFGFAIYESSNLELAGFHVQPITGELFINFWDQNYIPTAPNNVYGNYVAPFKGYKIPKDKWVKVKLTVEKKTGEITLFADGLSIIGFKVKSSFLSRNDVEPSFISIFGNGNAYRDFEEGDRVSETPGSMYFDNVKVTAVNKFTLDNNVFLNEISNLNFGPNPAKNFLSVTSDEELKTIKISDLNGRLIKSVDSNFNQISLEGINNGVYLTTIQSKSTTLTKKLIIE